MRTLYAALAAALLPLAPAGEVAAATDVPLPPLGMHVFGEDAVDSGSLAREMRESLAYYRRTGIARYASPRHRVTPLHVAALLHELPLAEELLARGADPNARLRLLLWYRGEEDATFHEADTPLTLVLRYPCEDVQGTAALARLLVAKGADIRCPGYRDWGVLACCLDGFDAWYGLAGEGGQAAEGTWEALAVTLIGMGAPAEEDDADFLLDTGWFYAYMELMQSPQGAPLRGNPLLMRGVEHYRAKGHSKLSPGQIDIMWQVTGLPAEDRIN